MGGHDQPKEDANHRLERHRKLADLRELGAIQIPVRFHFENGYCPTPRVLGGSNQQS